MNLTSVLVSASLVLTLTLSVTHSLSTNFSLERNEKIKNNFIKIFDIFNKTIIMVPDKCDTFFSSHAVDLRQLIVESRFPSTNIDTGFKKFNDLILNNIQEFVIEPTVIIDNNIIVKVYLSSKPFHNSTPLNYKRLFHSVSLKTSGPPLYSFEECNNRGEVNNNILGEMGKLRDEFTYR